MFIVRGISHNFQKLRESPRAAAVFRRASPRSVKTDWLKHFSFYFFNGLYFYVVEPAVAKVILVSEVISLVDEKMQSKTGFIEIFFLPFEVGNSVPLAADFKDVKVAILPSHDDLDHFVEFVKRHRTGHQHAAPNNRISAAKSDAQPKSAPLRQPLGLIVHLVRLEKLSANG